MRLLAFAMLGVATASLIYTSASAKVKSGAAARVPIAEEWFRLTLDGKAHDCGILHKSYGASCYHVQKPGISHLVGMKSSRIMIMDRPIPGFDGSPSCGLALCVMEHGRLAIGADYYLSDARPVFIARFRSGRKRLADVILNPERNPDRWEASAVVYRAIADPDTKRALDRLKQESLVRE